MTYDVVTTCENKDLMDKSHLEWLWNNYFEQGRNIKKLENLLGLINLELYIILLKVYNTDMDIDECLNGNFNEVVNEGVNLCGVEESVEEETIDQVSDNTDNNINSYKFILKNCLESLKKIIQIILLI